MMPRGSIFLGWDLPLTGRRDSRECLLIRRRRSARVTSAIHKIGRYCSEFFMGPPKQTLQIEKSLVCRPWPFGARAWPPADAPPVRNRGPVLCGACAWCLRGTRCSIGLSAVD